MADELDFDAVLRDVRKPVKSAPPPSASTPKESRRRSGMERAAMPPLRGTVTVDADNPALPMGAYGPMGEKHRIEGAEDENAALALGRKAAERFSNGWDPEVYRLTSAGGTEEAPKQASMTAPPGGPADEARRYLRAQGFAAEDVAGLDDAQALRAAKNHKGE